MTDDQKDSLLYGSTIIGAIIAVGVTLITYSILTFLTYSSILIVPNKFEFCSEVSSCFGFGIGALCFIYWWYTALRNAEK